MAHAGLLLWRHDAATAINMLMEPAKIAADRNLGGPARAAQLAVAYARKCRHELFEWSRSHPEDPSYPAPFHAHVTQHYLFRQESAYTVAKEGIKEISDSPRGSSLPPQQQQQQQQQKNFCLWHGLNQCRSRQCKFSHQCPLCSGNKPGCPSNKANGRGWLEWHLGELGNPKAIVSRDHQQSGHRDRSRSRQRGSNNRTGPTSGSFRGPRHQANQRATNAEGRREDAGGHDAVPLG